VVGAHRRPMMGSSDGFVIAGVHGGDAREVEEIECAVTVVRGDLLRSVQEQRASVGRRPARQLEQAAVTTFVGTDRGAGGEGTSALEERPGTVDAAGEPGVLDRSDQAC
jgi:hypothetical protein